MIEIRDPLDPRLADYRDLRARRTPSARSAPEHVVIEGRLALERCLLGPLRLRSVLMTPARARSLASLRGRLPPDVPSYVAGRDVLEQLTGFDVHRGVLASASRPAALGASDLWGAHGRIVVLEGLTDLENVGAAFRVAAGLGFGGVLLDHRCADPLLRRCVRVSLGWATVLPHARSSDLQADLAAMAHAGFRNVALTPAADAVPVDRALAEGMLEDPLALLVGSEGTGLTEETLGAAGHQPRCRWHPEPTR
ncbi:MAG: RNA methyltransferase [Microthrixaceae bacterium]